MNVEDLVTNLRITENLFSLQKLNFFNSIERKF